MLLAATSPLKTAPDTTRSQPDAPQVEPTPEEAANGWTAATLAEHLRQVEAREHFALMNRLFPAKQPLRVEAVSGYDPHSW